MPVPWRHMLLSPPVWAIVITHGASVFGYFTVVNQLPTYIESILKYSIKEVSSYIFLLGRDLKLSFSLIFFGGFVLRVNYAILVNYYL